MQHSYLFMISSWFLFSEYSQASLKNINKMLPNPDYINLSVSIAAAIRSTSVRDSVSFVSFAACTSVGTLAA